MNKASFGDWGILIIGNTVFAFGEKLKCYRMIQLYNNVIGAIANDVTSEQSILV